MKTRSRSTAVLAATSLAALGLAGCSSSDDAGDAPDGWQRIESGWLTLDLPDSWVDSGPVNDAWPSSWQDAEDEDDATVQVLANPAYGYYNYALEANGVALAGAQVGGFDDFKMLDRTGPADTADPEVVRTDFTYRGSDGKTYEGALWSACDRDTSKCVQVQLTAADLDDEIADQIGASIQVNDTDAEPTS